MNRFAKYITISSVVLLIASCTREMTEVPAGLKSFMSIEASISEMPYTKAHLQDGEKMKWEQWDEIGVFSDTDSPVRFVKKGTDNVFSAETAVNGKEFYAFYPYADDVFNASDRFVLNYWAGEVGIGKDPTLRMPMVAHSDGSSLKFKHTCGLLHFSITGSHQLKTAIIESNGGELIGGRGTINLKENEPVFKCDDGDGMNYAGAGFQPFVNLSKEEPLDLWFVVPPVTLSQGFTLKLEFEDGSVSKSTKKAVTVSRASIKNYSLVDLDELIEEEESALVVEREALIALYNATDGPHWVNNSNWCSDNPLSEWYGVDLDNDDHVIGLYLSYNGLNGPLPAEMAHLERLTDLEIEESVGHITHFDPIFDLPRLERLSFGIGTQWSEYTVIRDRMFAIPPDIGKLKNLKRLSVSGINADLPEELFGLKNLEILYLRYLNTGRPLQSGLGKMKNLRGLSISCICDDRIPGSNPVCGELPEDIYDLTNLEWLELVDTNVGGQLSPRIGELKNLNTLWLPHNQFSGPLPAELASLRLKENGGNNIYLGLENNHFSGKVPEAFRNWPDWSIFWGYITKGNNLDFTEVMPTVPTFEVTGIDGRTISSAMVGENELTLLFQWASWCPFSPGVVSELKEVYPHYKEKGLDVISYTYEEPETAKAYAGSYGFTWPTFANVRDDEGAYPLGVDMYPTNNFPSICIYEKSGRLVYYQIGAEGDWKGFVESRLGGSAAEVYESKDYSADGTVHTIQTATRGAGIDIIMMGDAYSDRLIADATYETVMKKATNAFFSEEPYKSFRDCFNVYYVDVVSKNERYDKETALATWYGSGTAVGGDNAKVLEYAKKAIPESRMDDATVIVLMNREYYAGTCYMFPIADGDYGRGLSISYFPASSHETTFHGLVSHEAAGHGFAKLADEYYYASKGTIPQEEVEEYRAYEPSGYWRNGDFTSDPAKVKWSRFLSDSRYNNEGLGVYSGAFTYYYGAWRPSYNSIMNNNTGGFNAPSRYAIWYKINKLAYGPSWSGTYEDFVTWDQARPKSAPARKARRNYVEKETAPLAPPVIVGHSWREELRN